MAKDTDISEPRYEPGQIDDSLATPLYHQIFMILREQIRTGDFKIGDVMPGEQELSRLFDVSRITVKRAMNELAAAGLVTRHRGRGTVVSYNASVPVVQGNFDTLMNALNRLGIETEVELLELSSVNADETIANHLGLETGDSLQRSVRLRRLEGSPFSYHLSYVPEDLAAGYEADGLLNDSVMALLEKSGVRLAEANQYISAIAAEPEMANILDVAPGAPLLEVTRVLLDIERRAVQYMQAVYRPDTFSYHIRMLRRGMGDGSRWDAAEFE